MSVTHRTKCSLDRSSAHTCVAELHDKDASVGDQTLRLAGAHALAAVPVPLLAAARILAAPRLRLRAVRGPAAAERRLNPSRWTASLAEAAQGSLRRGLALLLIALLAAVQHCCSTYGACGSKTASHLS